MVPLITVENLSMYFNGKKALKDISFEIAEGEIFGIIGRSGAGKTVLMHLIRGVDQPPTSGEIVYHMAICSRCGYMDVQSAAGTPCHLHAERT
jgi:methyl coenzyme M reductase system, component A2